MAGEDAATVFTRSVKSAERDTTQLLGDSHHGCLLLEASWLSRSEQVQIDTRTGQSHSVQGHTETWGHFRRKTHDQRLSMENQQHVRTGAISGERLDENFYTDQDESDWNSPPDVCEP